MTTAELEQRARTFRLKPGSRVRVDGLAGVHVVVENSDLSLLTLQTERGAVFKIGRLNAIRPEPGE